MIPLFDELPAAHNAWIRYQGREQSARATYLELVIQAHHEYLDGPWPDRESYSATERSAWLTYYHAARQAWHAYKAEILAPAAPPAARSPQSHPYPDNGESALRVTIPVDPDKFLSEPGGNH